MWRKSCCETCCHLCPLGPWGCLRWSELVLRTPRLWGWPLDGPFIWEVDDPCGSLPTQNIGLVTPVSSLDLMVITSDGNTQPVPGKIAPHQAKNSTEQLLTPGGMLWPLCFVTKAGTITDFPNLVSSLMRLFQGTLSTNIGVLERKTKYTGSLNRC